METIIFKDSPLAEYLEGEGENEVIEPSLFVDAIEPPQSFAPGSLPLPLRFTSSKRLKGLCLNGPGWRQRNYLYELFSKLADSRLSQSENSRFLERFRYIIVASQLLSEHINVSHYNRKAGDSLPSPLTDDDNESVATFGPRFPNARYWAGNGLCIGLVTVLVGWVLNWENQQNRYIRRGRTGVALLGVSIVGIFLFSNARRRWLRVLRGRSIELATQFVENCQAYDILAANAITFIQEVELISRGYRLSKPLPPISRLDRDSQSRRCARLRRSVANSLNHAMTPYSQAFTALRELTKDIDLDKYYDIYDIRIQDVQQIAPEVHEVEYDDLESLKTLKSLLHRLHTTRKVFLCCLLAIDANGGYSDFGTWRTVVEQLKTLSTFMGEIGEALQRCAEEEERFNDPPILTIKSADTSPAKERWRGQLRKLNSLSQALRGLQAKMQILREESDRTLQDSQDVVEFGPDLLAHYDSIGSDLHALMTEWESGRAMLIMSIDKQGGDTTSSRNSLISPILPTTDMLEGDTPRNSWGILSPTAENLEAVVKLREKENCTSGAQPSEEELDDSKTEIIFEGVAEPKNVRQKSTMTQEERIRKVQEERVRTMEERKKAETGVNLVKELNSVLANRPPMQQRRVPVRTTSDS